MTTKRDTTLPIKAKARVAGGVHRADPFQRAAPGHSAIVENIAAAVGVDAGDRPQIHITRQAKCIACRQVSISQPSDIKVCVVYSLSTQS